MKEIRRQIALVASDFYSGKISFKEFMSSVPDCESDEDACELIDLIEHEPKIGGILGISKEEHAQYMTRIFKLIEKLKTEDEV